MSSPEKEKEIQEVEDEQIKLEDLEKNFRSVMDSFFSDHSMDRFREEYELLYKHLVESHKNNQKLIEQCKDLNNSILANANKVSSVLTLSQDDQKTISGLRHEFEKAWKMVEISQDRENKSKEIIESLKAEIANLSNIAQQGDALSMTQNESLDETRDKIINLKKEMKVQEAQISHLKEQITRLTDERDALITTISNLKTEQENMSIEYQENVRTASSLIQEIRDVNTSLYDLKDVIIQQQKTSNEITDQINQQIDKNKRLGNDLIDYKRGIKSEKNDTYEKTLSINKTNQRLVKEKEKSKRVMNKIKKVNINMKAQLKNANEVEAHHKNVLKENRWFKDELEDEKYFKNENKVEKKSQLTNLQKMRKEAIKLKSSETTSNLANHSIQQKINQNNTEIRRINEKFLNERSETSMIKSQINDFQNDILILKSKTQQDRGRLLKFEEETDKYINISEQTRGLKKQLDDEINDYTAQNDQMIRLLNSKYDDVRRHDLLNGNMRDDRDKTAQNLLIAQKDTGQIMSENQAVEQTISMLKNNIREKDKEILQVHYDQKIVANECITLHKKVLKMKRKLKEIDGSITEIKNRIQRSFLFISEAEIDIKKIKGVNTRMNDSSRLIEKRTIRRDNEQQVLLDKIKVITSVLEKANNSYKMQIALINERKDQLLFEVERTKVLSSKRRHFNALKFEIVRLQKAVVEEAGRAKALEIEHEKPMNIHRWRFYESTNPEMALLIRIKLSLNDKLMIQIAALGRILNKKRIIQSKYEKQEKHLQNSYGFNFEEEKAYYIDLLKSKTRMLAHMQHQASNQQALVSENKEQVHNVRALVREEKAEFYEAQKKVIKLRAKTALAGGTSRKPLTPRAGNEVKYVGGGFAVGGNTQPSKEKPKRPQKTAKSRLEELPGIVLPLYTPRRMDNSDMNSARKTDHNSARKVDLNSALKTELTSARKKKKPPGWNRRTPIRPYIPTANGTDFM